MKKFIKSVPIPLAGVMLGFAALGNLLQSYSETLRYICGGVAGILLLLLLLKLIMYPSMIKEDLKNPIMASVSATFTMGIMLLSVYVKPFIGTAAKYIWLLAIVLHILLIVYFTFKFMMKLDFTKVFASYFIVYVGIAAAGITAPAYKMQSLGKLSFWFGFITLLLLLILVTYRHLKFKNVPEPAAPLFCIFTAPASLCLAAYIQSVQPKSLGLIYFLAVLSFAIYVIVLCSLPKYLKLKFYPSYAAFTFPFVISAIAMKQTMACLAKMGHPLPILKYVVLIETIIATILVVYTLIKFLVFLVKQTEKQAA